MNIRNIARLIGHIALAILGLLGLVIAIIGVVTSDTAWQLIGGTLLLVSVLFLWKPWRKIKNDLLFNPINWFGFLALYALVFGALVTNSIWGLFQMLEHYEHIAGNPVSGWIYTGIWVAVFILGFIPGVDKEGDLAIERVPQTFFVAYVTLFGMLLPLGRKTGNYPCTGTWVGLGRSTAIVDPVTDDQGFVLGGDITFEVWQSAAAKGDDRHRITEPTRNSAAITASLTLILERVKPVRWLDAEDAATEVGNAARQAYLQFLTYFNDTDVPSVVGFIYAWMIGKPIITAFTPQQVREFRTGSLLRDENGKVLMTVLEEGETEAAGISRFKRDFLPRANTAMQTDTKTGKAIPSDAAVIKTSHPVDLVIERRGYRLKAVTLEGVKLASKVQEEADTASSEIFQLAAQKRSAEAQEAYRSRLKLGANATPAEQLAATLAWAQDHPNSASVVIVPGGEPLTRAAAVAGAAIRKGSES